MSGITFEAVSYAWPPAPGEECAGPTVFSDLSLKLPDGFTFLVGPNGIGKSTFLLLAGARIFPQAGTITVGGADSRRFAAVASDPSLERARNELVSFVYQNMEFETGESIGTVFDLVVESGVGNGGLSQAELVAAADLDDRLSTRMHELSKGEMQRAIVVMSLLYGSPIVMMDEPVFAVEPERADRLLAAVRTHCRATDTRVYVSAHDVELARRQADSVVLFGADGGVTVGAPEPLLSRDRLEQAFRAPYDTLYERQSLYREMLRGSDGARRSEG